MEAAEWGEFVFENKDVLMNQMSGWLPLARFADIAPGTPYTVYLQKRRGSVKITFESVRLELDQQGRVIGLEIAPRASGSNS
jgi:hypothetical protein